MTIVRSVCFVSLVLAQTSAIQKWLPMCLRVQDVPRGFVETESRSLANKAFARLSGFPESKLTETGRVGGAVTAFRRGKITGFYFVRDDLSVFRRSVGAHEFYLMRGKELAGAVWSGWHFGQLRRLEIGDEASEWTARYAHSAAAYQDITIYFRRGRVVVGLDLEGRAGSFTRSTAARFARIIDDRVKQGQWTSK